MKILVIGSGGREHAIAWKLAQSPGAAVFVAPGNAGIALEPKIQVRPVSAADFSGIETLVCAEGIDFVVVGPDQALADGLVDHLESRGIAAFGPRQAAARLESSKAFAKELMAAVGIPTAAFRVFTEAKAAKDFLQQTSWGKGWVVKADGLALGKGVVVCATLAEALATIEDFFSGSFGEAGKRIVLEECLAGPELSAFSLCDGERAVFLGFACDHKRLLDGGLGPNTGGMGAYTPADCLQADTPQFLQERVVLPLLREMKRRGTPFQGILFTGIMMTIDGPKVLEFNVRFGDPETQALLPMIDEDILPWLRAAREGRLHTMPPTGPNLKSGSAVHVVMAASGYPGLPPQVVRKGDGITIAPELLPGAGVESERKVFFAGVGAEGAHLCTNGGRVLGITARGKNRQEARALVYGAREKIQFSGAQWRGDIGV